MDQSYRALALSERRPARRQQILAPPPDHVRVNDLAAPRSEAGHGGDEGVDRRGERVGLARDDVGSAVPVLGGDEGRAPIVALQRDVGGVGRRR